MLLEINDITPLKNFFDMIFTDTDIVEMKLDPEKLSISLLNRSHVAFYNLEISREFFEDYSIINNESILIFVEDFYKIIKSAGKNDTLFLESNDNYLICRFEHDNNRRVFELPLADNDYESAVPPSIDYTGEFQVLLDDLKQSYDDLDKIVKTEKFKIVTGNNIMSIVAPNDSMTQYNHIISVNSDVLANVTVNIDYIGQLLKLSRINNQVTLYINDDMPLSWNIHSPDELVKIKGLIAPIIEQED